MTTDRLAALLLKENCRPEEVFSEPTDLKRQKIQLLKLVHPDVCARADANELTTMIDKLFVRAEKRVENKVFGKRFAFDAPITTVVGAKKIELISEFTTTQSTTIFEKKDGGLVYLANNASENTQAAKLVKNHKLLQDEKWKVSFANEPRKLGSFGNNRNMYEQEDVKGFVPLSRLMDENIPVSHLAWIFNRICELLIVLHTRNLAHTSLSPSTIFIDVKNHKALLVGLESIEKVGTKGLKRKIDVYAAPELKIYRTATATMDLYSLVKIMELMVSKTWSQKESATLSPLMASVTTLGDSFRYSPAVFYERLKKIWSDLFGPPKWREFPTTIQLH